MVLSKESQFPAQRSPWFIPAAVLTVVSLAAMMFGGEIGLGDWRGVAKMLASTAFILMALAAGALKSRYGIAILVGLFFSWWGDLFLIFHSTFLYGLVAFLIGHIAYAVAFTLWGINRRASAITAALVVVPVFFVFQWLNPHLGDMRIPVYAYMLVITLMVILSAGATWKNGTPLMLVAALLFWVSDICVARQRFVQDSDFNALVGLPLYYGGQMVFAWSILAANRLRGIAP